MHIKYIIITIINTYNWEWIESMKMISIQLKITKQGRKGEQRIPHLLCSNDHNTPHRGDELG